ncbi:hypothetical protein FZEAL_8685 [Fusarium zealandicum]|uniref:Uncharacterized protein n=1 Tax=Fusarium zealandicum TaxID=1053134 RepID=A0A8H4UDF5_9HYPO|nr:hypothetical protein FZEAL_8685 [Fusarium zealandicum]
MISLLTRIYHFLVREPALDYDPREFPRYRILFPKPKTTIEMIAEYAPPVKSFLACNWAIFLVMFNTVCEFLGMVYDDPLQLPAAVEWIRLEYKAADGANITHGALLLFWLYRTSISLSYTIWDVLVFAFHRWVPFYRHVWAERAYWQGVLLRGVAVVIPATVDMISFLIVCVFAVVLLFQLGMWLFAHGPEDAPADVQPRPLSPAPLSPLSPSSPPSPDYGSKKPAGAGYVEVSPKARQYLDSHDITVPSWCKQPHNRTTNFQSIHPTSRYQSRGSRVPQGENEYTPRHYNTTLPHQQETNTSPHHHDTSKTTSPHQKQNTTSGQDDKQQATDLKTKWLKGSLSSVEREIMLTTDCFGRLKVQVSYFSRESNARSPTQKKSPAGGSIEERQFSAIEAENSREKKRIQAMIASHAPGIEVTTAQIRLSYDTFKAKLTNIETRLEEFGTAANNTMRKQLEECKASLEVIDKGITKAWNSHKGIEARCLQRVESLDKEVAKWRRYEKVRVGKRVSFVE